MTVGQAALLRQQYALAYSDHLSTDARERKRPDESNEEYAKWWHREHLHSLSELVNIAKEALAAIATDGRTWAARTT